MPALIFFWDGSTIVKRQQSIITYGFTSYNWLNKRKSSYSHINLIHGQNDFRYEDENTSYI
jgi:hypothetical protein